MTFPLGRALLGMACLVPGVSVAGPAADLAAALRLGDVVAVMVEEGVGQGDELDADLLQGAGGGGWARVVAGIYDAPALTERVTATFTAEMDADQASRLLDFFGSDQGREIVDLEIEARRAMLSEDVDTAAREAAADRHGASRERIDAFIAENDLVERNVAGAMNSSIAFYTGLAQGDAFGGDLDEATIIAEVWAQEPEIRRETQEWLTAFLGLAYAPLDEARFDAYREVSGSSAGRMMNAALFTAFDTMFEDVSGQLGRAAAAFLQGSEL